MVKQLKIQPQKDTKQLVGAIEITHKDDFYKRAMLVGELKGESV